MGSEQEEVGLAMVGSQNIEMLDKITLNIAPHELVRWIREEILENHIHLNFYKSAKKEYSFEEDFDHRAFGVSKGENLHLVSVEAILDIEPLIEQNYWFLQLIVTKLIGLRLSSEEFPYKSGSLTIDDFEDEFLKPGGGNSEIVLFTETKAAKKHFDEWFYILKSEHTRTTTH